MHTPKKKKKKREVYATTPPPFFVFLGPPSEFPFPLRILHGTIRCCRWFSCKFRLLPTPSPWSRHPPRGPAGVRRRSRGQGSKRRCSLGAVGKFFHITPTPSGKNRPRRFRPFRPAPPIERYKYSSPPPSLLPLGKKEVVLRVGCCGPVVTNGSFCSSFLRSL